jgi:hypothetical protein
MVITDKKANIDIASKRRFFDLIVKKRANDEENKKVNPTTILVNSIVFVKYKTKTINKVE